MYTSEMPKLNIDQEIRFWSRVIRTTEDKCWPYIGRVDKGKYGHIGYGNYDFLAHRIAYYLHNRVDPLEFLVCHSCDNSVCCNPHHLFLGTQQDNITDAINKNRPFNTKLTKEKVLEIRYKILFGYTYKSLGEEYNVDQGTIAHVVTRKSWRHI